MVLRECIYCSADPAVRLGGVLIRATPARNRYAIDGKLPIVVMAHGFGETIDFGLMPFATQFSQALGLHVFMFDNRSFGMSEGTPRQVFHATNQVRDWMATIKFVKTLPLVDPDRVVVWGDSLSGGHVINIAAMLGPSAAALAVNTGGSGSGAGGEDDGNIGEDGNSSIKSGASKAVEVGQVGGLFAAIAQVPMTSGFAAFAKNWNENGLMNNLRMVPGVLADVYKSFVSKNAADYVALTSPKTKGPSLLATESIYNGRFEQYENSAKSATSADFDELNRLAGRSLFSLVSYNPVKNIRRLRVPLLYQFADTDQLCPQETTMKVLARADKRFVDAIQYPGDHFMPYQWNRDGQFSHVVHDQLLFLGIKLNEHMDASIGRKRNLLWQVSVPVSAIGPLPDNHEVPQSSLINHDDPPPEAPEVRRTPRGSSITPRTRSIVSAHESVSCTTRETHHALRRSQSTRTKRSMMSDETLIEFGDQPIVPDGRGLYQSSWQYRQTTGFTGGQDVAGLISDLDALERRLEQIEEGHIVD
ncbi:hypothetical protein HDU83_006371 [Entophlyctis luteolus]|nr:hypothetical protein HDU83_006371 [Entophlyctis luteolus]